jgi:hypothetical protein
MAEPTPDQVHAALAVLAAAEAAREATIPVAPAVVPEPVVVTAPVVHVAEPVAAVDPYLARSVKASPNGF